MKAAVLLAALVLAGFLLRRSVQSDLGRPRDLHEVRYVGSDQCRRCHEDHYQSWHRTFHRTMTQEASAGSVLGAFDGRTLTYFGWTLRMTSADERYWVEVESPSGTVERAEVVRTVGSHRYQQYLARHEDVYWRLPVAWHLGEERFIHMNGAFLTADPATPDPATPASREDFTRHVTRWNDNCVFCHNVAPNPGVDGNRFETEVAELGVACEACHGPGEDHAASNAAPWRRYALHYSDDRDPSIVSPARLSSERSAEVCGRCHGQRKTDQLDAFLATGDPFVPGDDLARYSEPLWHDTTLAGEAPFEARFWADGTPRLTAYEYQGWLQSPCRADERWTCESCHAMHEGDPAGQLRPDLEGDRVCTQCHVVETPHAAHQTVDAQCVDCHMPRIVYGLIGAHRSHRVEVPSETTSRPNACALCHVDDGPLRDVFAGDPIERAIAADALGESAFGDDDQVRGVLLDVMEFDPYPAVRRIAFRALRKRATLGWEAFRPATPRAERQAQVEALRARVSHRPPNAAEVASLRALASAQAIEIGE